MEPMNLWDETINDLISKASQKRNPLDYEKNGLLFCGECNTPKQCKVSLLNKNMIVSCMCKCEQEKVEEEDRRWEKNQQTIRIRAMRKDGVVDKGLSDCCFDQADMTENLKKCKNYFDSWNDMRKNGTGLLLWGGVGTGKTFAAACIVNGLIEHGVSAMITSFPRILGGKGYFKSDIVDHMNEYELVVIDDLGVERSSEYALETVYMVVDERYKSKKPIIITTNLSLEVLDKPDNIRQKRIYDRILEMCVPIRFDGKSRRKKAAIDKANETSEIILREGTKDG